ncbi:MAG: radical SAM protein [SAR202 cluster bacterium]|nr:radical SAM protein [SAR202 cluster bacterium]
MHKKNVLLIYPTIIGEIPNSIAQISSVFESEGFNVHTSINSFNKPLTNKDFLDIAIEVDAEIIGISTLTFEINNTYKLIKSFKDLGLTVIVGGPHATTEPEEVINNGADIVVRNEGEETIKELCKLWKGETVKIDQEELKKKWNGKVDMGLKVPGEVADNFTDGLGSVLGITYFDKVEKKIRSNPPRKRIADLASLPKPNYDVFDHSIFVDGKGLIRGTHRIFTTRGCPAKCTFCDWGVFGQRVTFQNIPKIVEEMQRRVDQYGTTNFYIADDVFTVNKKHVDAFCKEVVKISPRIEWQAQTRAEFVDEEMLTKMKEAGCYLVGFGLESGDPETLRRMDKNVPVETNIKSTKLAAKAGLKVYANLMVGFPWETPKHIDNTLNMVREI